jgi:peroxiredoxin
VGAWLGWQLIRQNGRILLRLDELEKRVDELEFGEPAELDERTDTRSADFSPPEREPAEGMRTEVRAPVHEQDDRSARFNNRSLARSKIKRDGLKAGSSAPDFRLPRLDGGELSLKELRGRRVLLVFSDPECGPCNALAPRVEKFHLDHAEISVVMISRGELKENRAKVKEHGLTFPVVLQRHWEISRRYAMFATPVGYLIDEAGVIVRDVAVGVEPILDLMADMNNQANFSKLTMG